MDGGSSPGEIAHDETLAAKMKIGRYQIIEQLGRGAMGIVYKAYDPAIARTVAIKAIRLGEFADVSERHRVQERLLREAQSAGLLSHPSIVTIYDVLEEEESAYIFMEFVRGSSLDHLLREGNLPPRPELLGYLRQVADALDSAHRRGVIHRDIKPGNIILAEPDDHTGKLAKVADFGVAKFISQDTTHSGTMMGTPAYMSPEQIQGLISDGRSDQFSLAVVIYELLTGSKPFAGEGLPTLFYQICKVEAKPAHEVNASISPAASDVLAKALAKEPSNRFGSCLEFVGELDRAIKSERASARAAAAVSSASPVIVDASGEIARQTVMPEGLVPDAPVFFPPLSRRRTGDGNGGMTSRRRLLAGIAIALIFCAIVAAMLMRRQPAAAGADATASPAAAPSLANQPQALGVDREQATAARVQKQNSIPPYSAVPAPAPPASIAQPQINDGNSRVPALPRTAEIVTQPAGAEVVVDGRGETKCTAPCQLQLPLGRHTLTAVIGGYNLARKVFNVPEDPVVNVTLGKQEGVLVITTTPAESDVSVDGKEYGKTPARLRLSAGAHQLVLVNGDRRHEETITIQNEGFEARSFKW